MNSNERASGRNNSRPRMTYSNGEVRTKRIWSVAEDQKLRELVAKHSTKNWTLLAASLAPRTGKQCRERWFNHLADNLKKGDWSEEEDMILVQLQKVYGNQWTKIAKRLPHRTDSSIKNRWHNVMRHGVPAKFEKMLDENLLQEVLEEQRRDKELGGTKVYRKGTTISSVYSWTIPSNSDSSISTSSSESTSPSETDHDYSHPAKKKREIERISLGEDEMSVAHFLAQSGSVSKRVNVETQCEAAPKQQPEQQMPQTANFI